ncbi:hypothetical protein Tco_1478741, partial [Tanacetum coccineum]
SKLLNLDNPSLADNEIASLMDTTAQHAIITLEITSSFAMTIPPPPPFLYPLQHDAAPTPTPTTFSITTSTNPTVTLPEIPNFASVFKFNQRVYALESEMSELNQTNQFSKAVSSISGIVDAYLASKIKEAVDVDQVNAQVSKIMPNIEKYVTKSLGAEVLVRGRDDQDKDEDPSAGSNQGTKRRKSGKDVESFKDSRSKEKKSSSTSKDASQSQHKYSGKSVHAEEPSQTEVTKADWFKKPERPPTPDPDWSKWQQVDFRPSQTWISQTALAKEPPTSFDEFNDTSFDFSAFVLHRLNIPNLTQEILVGPTFNLLKGTCKSITELEYHLKECSKATTEHHRGRQIIPKDYFINKDLEYLKGGDLSRRYLTSVTKSKAANYELKWIEDLVPELWSPVQVKYNQHAYLGTSHSGPKRQRFYGYASNLTSSKDVYSRRRIITVTRLKIMKMYDYGHLEEIEVRRDDQKLYTFKEGDFKRLRLQDNEDLLLLLVQQKLTNLTIDERYDLNVALRMYTRRIVIQ